MSRKILNIVFFCTFSIHNYDLEIHMNDCYTFVYFAYMTWWS